jgi:site-specific DNA-methyltransferase (cytosine-N4-specific)
MSVTLRHGDCREILRTMPDESVDCCITSPPYFGQRDYGVSRQIGLELTPSVFVSELTLVFEEVRRVLRPEGTLWLNIGDSYNNRTRIRTSSHKPGDANGHGFSDKKSWAECARDGEVRMSILQPGLKEKDLIGIPWAVATALKGAGWILRQEIIWNKPVAKLDVATDRPATRHEQIFLFSKSKTYHFDRDALPVEFRGSVWTVPARGHDAHGASFPVALVEPMILAGTPKGGHVLDPFAGVGTTGVAAYRRGRSATLIELNPEFIASTHRRVRDEPCFQCGASDPCDEFECGLPREMLSHIPHSTLSSHHSAPQGE